MFDLIITTPLGFIIEKIYELVNNYGWAIIIFTIIIKMVVLPLTIKTYKYGHLYKHRQTTCRHGVVTLTLIKRLGFFLNFLLVTRISFLYMSDFRRKALLFCHTFLLGNSRRQHKTACKDCEQYKCKAVAAEAADELIDPKHNVAEDRAYIFI